MYLIQCTPLLRTSLTNSQTPAKSYKMVTIIASLLLAMTVSGLSTTAVGVSGNSYEDLYIGVSPDLSAGDCELMVNQLEVRSSKVISLLVG